MKVKIYAFSILLLLLGTTLAAQEPEQDPFEKLMFPPELVMQHQKAISLSLDQRNAIKQEIGEAQKTFTGLQWDMQDEMETFLSLLEMEKVDEQKAVAQLEKVLKLESEIKRTHLTLAIRIKNFLTAEQQTKLQELKKKLQ